MIRLLHTQKAKLGHTEIQKGPQDLKGVNSGQYPDPPKEQNGNLGHFLTIAAVTKGRLSGSPDDRFGSRVDMAACPTHVRFTPNNGH